MVEQKSSRSEDGKGVPPAGEQKTADTTTEDRRIFPGGSPDAANIPVGVAALDKDETAADDRVLPGVKSTS
jgi:hypothetical protein